ncbi:phosphatidylglycerophosphatase A [candidate division KSB1 bacterium]|nr:phosphatidylglycerophosphatase A [candidate division KSB1 bacterium]
MIPKLISTACGVGYSPVAPGTAGSIFALLIYFFIPENYFVFISTIFLLFIIGVWASTAIEKESIEKHGHVKGHDPQIVVIDEVVGMLITLIAIPGTWNWVIAGFVLFRIFDITKIYPINISQKMPRGWGIMMDDVLAGIYANLVLQIFRLFI